MSTTPTAALLEQLRRHYIAETDQAHTRAGGVFAHEVSINGTWGAAGSRRADALYAGFTSASGRILVGHELKVSRSDWRAELAHVGKADAWADACHQWWIVAPSTDIVPVEELPAGWGLMVPPRTSRGRRMQVVVKAETKPDHNPPWWAVRSLAARLDTLDHDERSREIQRIANAQTEARTKWLEERTTDSMAPADRRRLDLLTDLERSLGWTVESWRTDLDAAQITVDDLARGARIAATLKPHTPGLRHAEHTLRRIQDSAAALAEAIPEALAATGDRQEAGR